MLINKYIIYVSPKHCNNAIEAEQYKWIREIKAVALVIVAT